MLAVAELKDGLDLNRTLRGVLLSSAVRGAYVRGLLLHRSQGFDQRSARPAAGVRGVSGGITSCTSISRRPNAASCAGQRLLGDGRRSAGFASGAEERRRRARAGDAEGRSYVSICNPSSASLAAVSRLLRQASEAEVAWAPFTMHRVAGGYNSLCTLGGIATWSFKSSSALRPAATATCTT